MAEKRTCPGCGADWYSADPNDWICEKCEATITKDCSS
jgi:ribosomal protein S27AE